jgi:predicted GNAT superfamily acetyltransferase
MTIEIGDLHTDRASRRALLEINNASVRETSLMTPEKFDRMISSARVATFIAPSAALLLAFEQGDDYDGGHFLWFRGRFEQFIYIDRVVVATHQRRLGLGRLLYADLFRRAEQLGQSRIVCEVNSQPPNPTSDAFHAAQGFDRSAARHSTTAPKAYDIFSDIGLESRSMWQAGRHPGIPVDATTSASCSGK